MKIRLVVFLTASLIMLAGFPSAAQAGTRAPVVVPAASINNVASAQPFHPAAQFVVTGVQTATIEALEPDHTCAPGADSRSVWFTTDLMPGALTLDTTSSTYTVSGGTSSNTVISLYRMTNYVFTGFGDLSPLACNDNGSGPGIINAFNITSTGTYMVQISAAPGVAVTGASEVRLLANFAPAQPLSFDEPSGARKLKIPSLPVVVNIGSATVSLNEPFDPLALDPANYPPTEPDAVTNTVWFKFTYTERRIFAVSNFYDIADIRFSLFQKVGSNYIPAPGILDNYRGSLTAVLDPGTYYLRVGMAGSPEGNPVTFITFAVMAYLTDPNFDFSLPGTEGKAGATADLTGWAVKKGNTGVGGDEVFCDGAPNYACGFRFTSAGASEATTLKAVVGLNAVKFKKGDIFTQQLTLLDMVGTPNLKFSVVLTNAAGATQVYNMNLKSDEEMFAASIIQLQSGFTPVKVMLKLKNKDKTSGNSIEINSAIAAVLRVGEPLRHGGALKLPLGGELSSAWAEAASTAPKGVLPVPPPAQ